MDVLDRETGLPQISDPLGEDAQRMFQDYLEINPEHFLPLAEELVRPERNTLTVSFAKVQQFSQGLGNCITEDYYRVYPYLCRAVRNYVKDHSKHFVAGKDYYVAFEDVPTRLKVRELTTDKIGRLIRISGQVVRTHPVHPELTLGSFTCVDCGILIKNIEQQFKYTQPTICMNNQCSNRSKFILETSASRFIDFQKVRIQETQAELPRGSIPRSLEVIVHAEAVEVAQAGDRCDFIGTLITVPDVGALNLPGARAETGRRIQGAGGEDSEGLQGLKSLGVRELNYRLAFMACKVIPTNASHMNMPDWDPDEITNEKICEMMQMEEWQKVLDMSNDQNLYENLSTSLFPTIHANDEVKKGILLMLFGGVPKITEEGTSLRGDINVCIVGDPSTAKSQLLRQVADFCPRAVYTSGKASTAAGLTAAVVKDEESFEFVIEAGALMLADNGVCCIDEFDKMDPRDQVAIHEAMEQQTISITKAGIKATLNARTSILAAANPVNGRYNKSKSLKQNVNMGAPILSRFDLFFILIDEPNEVQDYAIARKIIELHTTQDRPVPRMYSHREILDYILFARQFKPRIGKEAAKRLVYYYQILRQRDAGSSTKVAWRITVRQLESLVRLSEAYARLHCCEKVLLSHVEEAYKLLSKSIIRVEQPEVELAENEHYSLHLVDENGGMPDNNHEDDDDEDERRSSGPNSPANGGVGERMDEGGSEVGSLSRVGSEGEREKEERGRGKKVIKLKYEEYKNLSNLILLRLRLLEPIETAEDDVEERRRNKEKQEATRLSNFRNWYAGEIQDDIPDVEALNEKMEIFDMILERIIKKDKLIIPLYDAQSRNEEGEEDPLLVVHPNAIIDD